MDNNQMSAPQSAGAMWFQPKVILKLVALLCITGIVVVAIIRERIVNPPQNQVSITGQGRVSYQADQATVTLGVQVDKAATAEEALNQLNTKMASVTSALMALGIPATDVQTQNYNLSPRYDYPNNVQTPTGYTANQQLTIKVRGLDKDAQAVSKVVAAATKDGANQVLGIGFDVSNLNDLKQQARLKAIADAKTKAGQLADAVGVRLGEVTSWWENVVQAPGNTGVPYADGKGGIGGGGGGVSPTVPSGAQEIIIEVSLNYKIK